MDNALNFKAQRWTLAESGQTLVVENAWSWSGDMQERVRLNGEVIFESYETRVLLGWTKIVELPWPAAASPLVVEWKSGLLAIKARARINKRVLPWSDYHIAKWQGALGDWPD